VPGEVLTRNRREDKAVLPSHRFWHAAHADLGQKEQDAQNCPLIWISLSVISDLCFLLS
jgi:hypothetical protein